MIEDPKTKACRSGLLNWPTEIFYEVIIRLIGPVIVIALFFIPTAEAAQFNPDRLRLAQTALAETVRSLEIPGAIAAVHSQDGETWYGAAGLSRIDRADGLKPSQWYGQPMTTAMHLRIGSVTKTFTATLIMILAQEGRLSLDDTVDKWLPGVVSNSDRITIRQLLNMTSGLPDYLNATFIEHLSTNYYRQWAPEKLVADLTPAFEPGQPGHWLYSNTNYILLGLIAEKAGGGRLEDLLRVKIIDPLGLADTYLPRDSAMPTPYAHGYNNLDGAIDDVSFQNPSYVWAAGGIVSTAKDMAVWARALAQGLLLNEKSRRERFTFVETMGPNFLYGLGVSKVNGFVGHNGTVIGYSSAVYNYRDYGFAVLVNGHSAIRNDVHPAEEILKNVAAVFFKEDPPQDRSFSPPGPQMK